LAWLRDHPEVDRHIVIDDEDDELDSLPSFQLRRERAYLKKLSRELRIT
jgi:hypothetical protein